jgi:glutamine---fructose-6-phosphate transaminase (isomerizing)
MCGLWGLLRAPRADRPDRASDAFVTLGELAEGRGRDAAGVAVLSGQPVRVEGEFTPFGRVDEGRSDLSHAGCRVVKGRGAFGGIWQAELLSVLDRAPVALGHTRWATQGSPLDLNNASPLVVPGAVPLSSGIVATHNGDVEAASLRERFAPPSPVGATDSEPIFQVLAGCREVTEVTDLLTALVGRAALVWVDRARPDRVHLARAALSPLTLASDTEQNIYWGSNPGWFHEVERRTAVRFPTVVTLPEGTYLQVGLGRSTTGWRRPRPRVLARASFRPTARPFDLDERVWTGFSDADRNRDRAGLRHRVAGDDVVSVA